MQFNKGSTHALGISESDRARDLFHWFRLILQPYERGFHPQTFYSPSRRFSGLTTERAAELPRTEMNGFCQALDVEWFRQMLTRKGERKTDAIA